MSQLYHGQNKCRSLLMKLSKRLKGKVQKDTAHTTTNLPTRICAQEKVVQRSSCLISVIFCYKLFKPLLADLLLYSYGTDFIQGLLKKNGKKLAQSFNLTFRDIDNVLSLTNSRFGDFVDRIYPMNLK
jgi:hypothetical protein